MTSTPRGRRYRWRWIAALTAVLATGLTGIAILLAVTAHPGTAHADPLCDQMRREHGPYWPCINVPTYTPLPTQYTAPPTPTTGNNSNGPNVGGEPGTGPGTSNATPIIPVPGYRAPGLPGQQPPAPPQQTRQQQAPPAQTGQPTPPQSPRPAPQPPTPPQVQQPAPQTPAVAPGQRVPDVSDTTTPD
ncbi:hypothetical protein [Gordonia crocea]|uniref:Uncharacterized protein n=1 Tax=Gordonia crocea TaxID=589162 RepID=A0A7I9V0B3_9ACTN|nr:hypothetical protein [Gordonia crocea]GED98877.1 hypothetical protein nbrc107697_29160 [Gordonia crocea]